MRNANFQALPQIYRTSGRWGLAIRVLTSSPANSDPHWSLRTTDAAHEAPGTHHPVTQPFHPFLDLLLTWPVSASSPDGWRDADFAFCYSPSDSDFSAGVHQGTYSRPFPAHSPPSSQTITSSVTHRNRYFKSFLHHRTLYNYKIYGPSWQIHKHTFHRTSWSPPRTPE